MACYICYMHVLGVNSVHSHMVSLDEFGSFFLFGPLGVGFRVLPVPVTRQVSRSLVKPTIVLPIRTSSTPPYHAALSRAAVYFFINTLICSTHMAIR